MGAGAASEHPEQSGKPGAGGFLPPGSTGRQSCPSAAGPAFGWTPQGPCPPHGQRAPLHLGAAVLPVARRGPPNKAHEDTKPPNVPSWSDTLSRKAKRSGPAVLSLPGRTPGLPEQPRPCAIRLRAGALRAGAERGARQLPLAPGIPRVSRGGACVMTSWGGASGGGKRRREHGGGGELQWGGRARGPGPCPGPQQGPRQRRPLRAAVVRAQAVNEGCSGSVGGRAAGRARGNPGAGDRGGREDLSGAGGFRVVSGRLFEEGEGHGSLSPPGVEGGRSAHWKRSVGQNIAWVGRGGERETSVGWSVGCLL